MKDLNFDVFESIVGGDKSVEIIAAAMAGIFVSVVLIRIGFTVSNQFNLLRMSKIELSELINSYVFIFIFLIATVAFVQLVS